jgi:heme oxygenase
VDLRKDNFVEWRERLRRIAAARPDIATGGSAAFSRSRYLLNEFTPGEVVGWFFANEADEMGIVGHRIL